jgi:peptide subunit release factor 1 (eRF1)
MYVHSSNNTQLIKSLQFELPSQHKTGGSSAARMSRTRDEKINLCIRKIAEMMMSLFVRNNIFQHIGLIIAGPSTIKEKIQSEKIFLQHFSKYLLRTITIAEIEDTSIYHVLSHISDISTGLCDSDNIVLKFETMILDPEIIDLIIFGESNVLDEYNAGNLAELFIDKNIFGIINVSNPKTIVHVIQNSEFINKYGSLVGIKYFVGSHE